MAGDSDLISDIHMQLVAAGCPPDIARSVLLNIRRIWGGTEVYIKAVDRDSRNQKILQSNAPPKELAKSVGCCEKTVKRVRQSWGL